MTLFSSFYLVGLKIGMINKSLKQILTLGQYLNISIFT